MSNNPFHYLAAMPQYLEWLAISIGLLVVSALSYCRLTPKPELTLIRAGSTAAAISLGGALIGFALTIGAVMLKAEAKADLLLWAVAGVVVQLVAYMVASRIIGDVRSRFERDEIATGVTIASIQVAVSIINAAVMVS